MAKIQTFDLGRWSEPDENHRVSLLGMADAKKTFEELKTHLAINGLLPDEYFLFSDESNKSDGELPIFGEAICLPNFGASEGIYLDIWLECHKSNGTPFFVKFATGKTLGETADDYYRMFRIAAECSLMLNGHGQAYERNNVDIVLTEKEADAVANSVELELCAYQEPEMEALLSSALDKITCISYATIQTVTCHGKDDFSLWTVDIPTDMLRSILKEGAERVESLENLMDGMDTKSGCEMRLLTREMNENFAFYIIPEQLSYLQEYSTQGCSVRGNKEQIMDEIYTAWEAANGISKEPYQEVEIFDQPALFSNGRVNPDDLPNGICCYDLRGSDYDPGYPVSVEKKVVVNHAGSLLTVKPLDLDERGCRMLTEDEGLNFTGGFLTLQQFMQQEASRSPWNDQQEEIAEDMELDDEQDSEWER